MTTEIQENFNNHTHHGGNNDQAIDEGGGCVELGSRKNSCSMKSSTTTHHHLPSITLKPSTPNDAGAHECSSSSNDNIQITNNTHTSTTKAKAINGTTTNNKCQLSTSDNEEGFLSTSPDSANEELLLSKPGAAGDKTDCTASVKALSSPPPLYHCSNPKECVTVKNILESFKAPLSEEQAWALLYQLMSLYRRVSATGKRHIFQDLDIPESMDNISLHRDGTVHCTWSEAELKRKEKELHDRQKQQEEEEQSGKFRLRIRQNKL